MIKVQNINGSPASNPHLGFGSASDANFFYFFESEADKAAYYASLPAQTATPETTAKNSIISTAQSAVGVTLNNLTAAQVRSLMAILLFKAGGVDANTLAVKPLNQWA